MDIYYSKYLHQVKSFAHRSTHLSWISTFLSELHIIEAPAEEKVCIAARSGELPHCSFRSKSVYYGGILAVLLDPHHIGCSCAAKNVIRWDPGGAQGRCSGSLDRYITRIYILEAPADENVYTAERSGVLQYRSFKFKIRTLQWDLSRAGPTPR